MNVGAFEESLVVRTIGHSTRTLEEFIHLLKGNSVAKVIDIRTLPRSRKNPQFNRETLPSALNDAGIGYTHMAGLGGLRRPNSDSPNTGWRNQSFRGFADYMQTDEFELNLQILIASARHEPVALMCAEAVPWRCHRSLIADALTVRKVQVQHIISAAGKRVHTLTPWAQVDGLYITYPPPGDDTAE